MSQIHHKNNLLFDIEKSKLFRKSATEFCTKFSVYPRRESSIGDAFDNTELNPILAPVLLATMALVDKAIDWSSHKNMGLSQTIGRVRNTYAAARPLRDQALYRFSEADIELLVFLKSFMENYVAESVSYRFPITQRLIECPVREDRVEQDADFAEVAKLFLEIPIMKAIASERDKPSTTGWSR